MEKNDENPEKTFKHTGFQDSFAYRFSTTGGHITKYTPFDAVLREESEYDKKDRKKDVLFL